MAATSPESSSLSVNISSVTEMVSFSLTIGSTPLASIVSMQLRWLRYCRRVERLSFGGEHLPADDAVFVEEVVVAVE